MLHLVKGRGGVAIGVGMEENGCEGGEGWTPWGGRQLETVRYARDHGDGRTRAMPQDSAIGEEWGRQARRYTPLERGGYFG